MRIVEKKGWFWTALHWIVFLVTFGRNSTFRSGYLTTIGSIIAVPLGWDPTLPGHAPVIAHERAHIRQQKRMGFGNVWVGLIPWGLAYLFLPLPIGLAWCRYRFEREAYAEGFRAELVRMRAAGEGDVGIAARREQLIATAVEQLTTGAYFWCWPFPATVRRYFEEHV